MNNAGIRDTARALHISINAVVRALKKLSPRCVTILHLSKYQHIEYMTGFSYRKPVGIPHKFSAEAQKVFVETYNELKQKAGEN